MYMYICSPDNQTPPPHTQTIYTVATPHLVVLILVVTNSNHDNFEHVMIHAIHQVHQQWWNISASVLTVHAATPRQVVLYVQCIMYRINVCILYMCRQGLSL